MQNKVLGAKRVQPILNRLTSVQDAADVLREQAATADDDEPANPSCFDEKQNSKSDDLAVEVQLNVSSDIPTLEAWLHTKMIQALIRLEVKEAQLTLVIVGDPEMASLHEQYKQVVGTTDVLTFDLSDQPSGAREIGQMTNIEGDLVLCFDEAQRQATLRNHDTLTELLLYAVHGVLHLLGYDDHDPKEAKTMHDKEDEILDAMGLGSVFYESDREL